MAMGQPNGASSSKNDLLGKEASDSSLNPPTTSRPVIQEQSTLSTDAELSAWRKYQTNRVGYSDMLDLAHFSNSAATKEHTDTRIKTANLAENLRVRWKAHLPYTSIGHQILVVVNPHDSTIKRKEAAKETTAAQKTSSEKENSHTVQDDDDGTFVTLTKADRQMLISDPRGNCAVQEHSQSHIFAYGTRVYWHMLQEQENQVIVLSGESGSGKTQMAKLIVRQLAHLSDTYARRVGRTVYGKPHNQMDSGPSKVSHRLVAALKLIETFTHAQTVFNSNSSRMHKYTELQFSRHGKLVGAKIVDLLLERRRETKSLQLTQGEGNFHVFYDMFVPAMLTREERDRYSMLESVRSYKYLQHEVTHKLPRKQLRKINFENTRTPCNLKDTLRGCGFDAKRQDEIFKLLSAAMLMGNLEFTENELKKAEGSYVKNSDILDKCAYLLGLYPDVLETTLTQKTSTVGVTLCADFLTPAQSRASRDDFVVALYRLLVDSIMDSINRRMSVDKDENTEKVPSWDYWISMFEFGGLENYGLYSDENDGKGNRFFQFITNFADERISQWACSGTLAVTRKYLAETEKSISKNSESSSAERSRSYAGSIRAFVHPSNGLIAILDLETIRVLESAGNPDQDALQLVDLFNRANHTNSKRHAIFGKNLAEAVDTYASSYFSPGHTKSSFGVKHYCGSSIIPGQAPNGLKIAYETSDFITANQLGGRGEGSQGLAADYARLIMGTADFPASRNPFLISMVSRLVDLKSHPRANRTIVSAVRKQDIVVDSNVFGSPVDTLKRMPSVRRNPDDKRLASILAEKATGSTAVQSTLARQAMASSQLQRNKVNVDDASPARPPMINTLIADAQKDSPLRSAHLESPGYSDVPDSPRFVPQIATPTAASEFYSDLTSILDSLKHSSSRLWNVICVKPNDERSPEKFVEDRVKEQIKRLNIGVYVSERCGQFTRSMTWKQFEQAYGVLEVADQTHKGPAAKHERSSSLASIPRKREALKAKCVAIYEMYGLVTRAGNGKAEISENKIYMDERSWWALERNVLAQKLAHNLKVIPTVTEVAADDDDNRSIQTAASQVSNEDMDRVFQRDLDAQIEEQKRKERERQMQNITPDRRRWMNVTAFMTWWIPTMLIRKWGGMESPDVIQAWREKVALCCITIFLSSLMLFVITGFGTLLCPTQHVFSAKDIATNNGIDSGVDFMSINGAVYDFSGFMGAHNSLVTTIGADTASTASSSFYTYAGKDASLFFPRRGGTWTTQCAFGGAPKTVSNNPSKLCNGPTNTYCHDNPKFVKDVLYKSVAVFNVGTLALALGDINIHNSLDPDRTYWVILDKRVYDVTEGMRDKIFPEDISIAIELSVGTYAAGSHLSTLKSSASLACLDQQFFIGVVDDRTSEQCVAASYSLLALTVVLCMVMLMKFLGALNFGGVRRPEEIDRYVICQVPCYTEGEESLKKTINSLALLDYEDSKKLLFIVADGLIKGSGNDRMTPEIVLDLLGVENSNQKLTSDSEVKRHDYMALGDGMNRLNRAKVFSGYYYIHSRRIPYIVVVKCGKESESRRPGNRGKRDSQMIMMKFLNKAFYQRSMVPLEVEIYRHINEILGVDPLQYEYCLMVDADTEVMEDSLSRLVAVMLHDSLIMGVCGETEIGNPMDSWVTMIQVYEYYTSHHLAKAFESLFGSVTCLPGCFSMYRIRTNGAKKFPLLTDDRILHEYEENIVDTLHKKNLLSLGEDRYLTTLMLKFFPEFRTKFTRDAACRTIVPDKFPILLSQRRRWINSTIHNLFELLRVEQLCGCLCFSMRMVIFLDLFATLVMPASIGYLAYLIYLAVKAGTATVIAESLYLFAAVYGLQAVIFLLRMKWDMIGWLGIYLLSLPIYGIILPCYAFWHFDDFSWGNTRAVHGEVQAAHGASGDVDVFDEKNIIQTDAKLYAGDNYAKHQLSLETKSSRQNNGNYDEVAKTASQKSNNDSETRIYRDSYVSMDQSQKVYTERDLSDGTGFNEQSSRPVTAQGSIVPNTFWPQQLGSQMGSVYGAPYPMYMPPNGMITPIYGVPYGYPAPFQSSQIPYPYVLPYGAPMMHQGSFSVPPSHVGSQVASPHHDRSSDANIFQVPTQQSFMNGEIQIDLVQGVPSTLHPVPESIPLCLGRLIYAEVKAILQSLDLQTLTKRKVREAVDSNINKALDELETNPGPPTQESKGSETGSLKLSQSLTADLKEFSALDVDIDLEQDRNARDWVNRCIGEELKIIAQNRSEI